MHELVIIVLTFNEEVNLKNLIHSLGNLQVPVVIVDSGSTDGTLTLAKDAGYTILHHDFVNHPLQWDYAIHHCPVKSKWVIGLDADQQLSPILLEKLKNFRDDLIPTDVNGIYFNRHNYFQGHRLRFGGYRDFYMLKMFKSGKAKSDLSGKLDHRFLVEGKTIIWKDAVLKEDNHKEYDLDFWLNKHVDYSNKVAEEELQKRIASPTIQWKVFLLGSHEEKKAFFRNLWIKLPLFVRPRLYFIYRYYILLGFLENRTGRMFHYLQAYWFRVLIDYKIEKKLK